MKQDKQKNPASLTFLSCPLQIILENILFSIANSFPPILCLTRPNEAFVLTCHEITPVKLNNRLSDAFAELRARDPKIIWLNSEKLKSC